MAKKISPLKKQRYWRLNTQAFLSRYVGYFVIFIASLTYVTDLWKQPIKSIFGMSFSGLAIIVALSALAFTMVPCLTEEKDKRTVLYAGEKFFQSSIFLIQAILLKYAGEAIKGAKLFSAIPSITSVVGTLIDSLSVICVMWSTYVFLYGYNELNDFLWERYLSRMKGNEATAVITEKANTDA